MGVFAIISQIQRPELTAKLEAMYGTKAYKISDTNWFVSDEGTAIQVADKIGAGREGDIKHGLIVVSLTGSYWGRATTDTWDWLQKAVQGAAHG